MSLFKKLPTSVQVGELTIELETGASTWIALYGKEPEPLLSVIKEVFRNGLPVPLNSLTQEEALGLYERLAWFGIGGKEKDEEGGERGKERLVDYRQDFNHIRTAMLQSYGVNILQGDSEGNRLIDTMHWWDFIQLVGDLSSGSVLTDHLMYYRGLDVSKLPSKTKADKEHIRHVVEMKRQVALDVPREKKNAPPPYMVKARGLRGY